MLYHVSQEDIILESTYTSNGKKNKGVKSYTRIIRTKPATGIVSLETINTSNHHGRNRLFMVVVKRVLIREERKLPEIDGRVWKNNWKLFEGQNEMQIGRN